MFKDAVVMMPDPKFWIFALIATGLSLLGLWGGRRGLKRARNIEDVPTAKIRSAHQGYVELEGQAKAIPDQQVISPLRKIPCCWYRYKIEKERDNKWETIKKGSSDALFLIDDRTGDCVIDPEGADVIPQHKETWHGNHHAFEDIGGTDIQRLSPGTINIGGFSANISIGSGGDYRYTEETIVAGDFLYAIGLFKSLDDLDHQTNRSEIVRDLLRQWKADASTLMERFDHNRDGKLDEDEWADARRVAQQKAIEIYAETETHLHTLSKPLDNSMMFLISSRPQESLVSRYRWQSRGGFLLFLVSGAVATAMISARFA
ncbi:MAG: GIDE domain-containing protein [bacterium]